MAEQPKNMPLLSPAQPTLSESSSAPTQPTLSENAENSSAPAKLTPIEIILRDNMSRSTASEEEYNLEEEDDDEEDDEQLRKQLKIKRLHCETCPAPSFHLRPCKCENGRHAKGCALSDGGGNKKCGRCGGPLSCTHDIFGPSGDFIDTGRLPCGYCVLPAFYTKMKGV